MLAVLALYQFVISPVLPHDHNVVVRIGTAASSVERVELVWTSPKQSEPIAGATFNFPRGSAPPDLQTKVRAPAGEVRLEMRFVTADGIKSAQRTIELGADSATVIVPVHTVLNPSQSSLSGPRFHRL